MGKLIPIYSNDINRLKAKVKERFYQKTTCLERQITGASLKMRMKNGQCIFLDNKSCRYYNFRPNTCRRHPFLITKSRLLVSSTCLGIDWASHQKGSTYKLFSKKISSILDSYIDRTFKFKIKY